MFQRDITINGFDSLGNMMVDDVLDSVKLQIDTVMYYNMLAQKQYELSNHLGNVIATVNDRKTPVIVGTAVTSYRADVISAQYYYPFGSPMPGKTFDASKQVVEEAVFNNTFNSDTEDWEAFTPAAVPTQSSGRLRVQCNAVWAIIKKEINVVKGKPYILRFTIDMGTATSITVPVYDNTITAAVPNTQTITSSGTYEYRFIANDDVMNILYEYKPGNPSSGVFYLDDISLLEEKLGYAYAFNGKPIDKETGDYDYGFRIYNPDLGRFLSVDPLAKSYAFYTPYQFAGNKPIVALDLDGLEDIWFHYVKKENGSMTKLTAEDQVQSTVLRSWLNITGKTTSTIPETGAVTTVEEQDGTISVKSYVPTVTITATGPSLIGTLYGNSYGEFSGNSNPANEERMIGGPDYAGIAYGAETVGGGGQISFLETPQGTDAYLTVKTNASGIFFKHGGSFEFGWKSEYAEKMPTNSVIPGKGYYLTAGFGVSIQISVGLDEKNNATSYGLGIGLGTGADVGWCSIHHFYNTPTRNTLVFKIYHHINISKREAMVASLFILKN